MPDNPRSNTATKHMMRRIQLLSRPPKLPTPPAPGPAHTTRTIWLTTSQSAPVQIGSGRSLEIVHSPVWEPGVAASLLTVWSHGLNQDRGSVEDARLHKKVEIAASYQRFLIAPFALVAAGFGQ